MTEEKDTIIDTEEVETSNEPESTIKPKGRFITAIGRRKNAVANVRLYKKGTGVILVNDMKPSEYFTVTQVNQIRLPLKLTGIGKEVDLSIQVSGGGTQGQTEAIVHGIARALVDMNIDLRPALKAKGYMTRDARKKERKKPGLKKARRAPQWAKR